ncbi:MAG: glycosyltransferase [Bacteroidota bacterium]|nr:glycosyltransferase [Bacteroidota bacterium]
MKSIEGRDIIVVGQQPWDVSIGSNCKNIALEFCKKNRVLYVNSPLDRITSIKDKKDPKTQKRLNVIKGRENGLILLKENLWNLYPDCLVESVNSIPVDFIFNWINKANAKKFVTSIQKALTELNFKNYILFNDNEIIKCFYLTELLQPSKSVYYSRDYILATEYWKKHGKRLEPLVIAKNDVCVANSTYLRDYCEQYNPNAYYVGQGCELEIFKKDFFQIPQELKNLNKPVIGYVGALLSSRLDIDILLHIAQQKPEWLIVLTGPEDDDFKNCSLHQMENVLFTGHEPAEELPDFINAFDVCINPQIVNELTVGNYPRKIDEYLAMGKPVVATKTKTMEIFEGYVYMADNKEAYIAFIEKALKEDDDLLKQRRKDFAALHTWENSVAEIYEAISLS